MEELENAAIVNRLNLIEAMMAEGRHATQRWGWMFLLWGIGPLLAITWESHWTDPSLAWPVVTVMCVIANGILIKMSRRKEGVRTTLMRSVGAVWASSGLTVLLIAIAGTLSGFGDPRSFYVAFFAIVGAAHSASSMILRWLPQFLAAVVWWAATAAALVLPPGNLRCLSVAALVSNVIFGAWLTYREWSPKNE